MSKFRVDALGRRKRKRVRRSRSPSVDSSSSSDESSCEITSSGRAPEPEPSEPESSESESSEPESSGVPETSEAPAREDQEVPNNSDEEDLFDPKPYVNRSEYDFDIFFCGFLTKAARHVLSTGGSVNWKLVSNLLQRHSAKREDGEVPLPKKNALLMETSIRRMYDMAMTPGSRYIYYKYIS